MKDLVHAWGSFLDTLASVAGIDTFVAATKYNIDDYHRFQVPGAGTIREAGNISGRV